MAAEQFFVRLQFHFEDLTSGLGGKSDQSFATLALVSVQVLCFSRQRLSNCAGDTILECGRHLNIALHPGHTSQSGPYGFPFFEFHLHTLFGRANDFEFHR